MWIRLWDQRHMIAPLSYFIEKPFQNWTRETRDLIGSVIIHVGYSVLVPPAREKLIEFLPSERAAALPNAQAETLQSGRQ